MARHPEFDSPNGHRKERGYLDRPAGSTGKVPVVLVALENRGFNHNIKDVARRLDEKGLFAFAPDALHPFGGYIVNVLAAALGDQLDAGVPFYGIPAEKEIRGNLKAAFSSSSPDSMNVSMAPGPNARRT